VSVRIHLNGALVPESEAVVSVFDRGFLYGDGVFESMRAVRGTIFRLPRHLARLERSAALIGLEPPPAGSLADAARDLLRANRLSDARLRLTLTRGPGRPGDYVHAPGPPTVVITAAPFTGLEPALHERGVAVVIPARRQVPPDVLDPTIKSIARLSLVLARREAAAREAHEAILLDAAGHLTEGTASNLFLMSGGRLLTPRVPGEALPGITREAVIEVARAAGLAVEEQALPASLVGRAEEAFLTNSSWEVLPIVRVDGRPLGSGRPGPVAGDLLRRYRDLVRRECGGD
jgi:branched-chain amino acid aminotransferase